MMRGAITRQEKRVLDFMDTTHTLLALMFAIPAGIYANVGEMNNDNMRRSFSTGQGLRVLEMSKAESMEQLMEKELAEAVEMMNRANRAIDRLFNTEETSVGTCDRCNSWDDTLEKGICQTCIKGEDE